MNVWQKLTLLVTLIALFFQGVVSKAKATPKAAPKPAAKASQGKEQDADGDGVADD